jgi:phosphatidylglycerol---prolipoprotein diacylglyceryl transferase
VCQLVRSILKNTIKSNLPKHPALLLGIALVILSTVLVGLAKLAFVLPHGISLLGVNLHFYGLIIFSGVFATTYFAENHMRQLGVITDNFKIWDYMFGVFFAGIVGARIFHVISEWHHVYSANPISALFVWDGGLSIFGGLLFGVVAVWLVTKWQQLDFWQWVGVISMYMPLGQIIGRYGNYVNQELYGRPTDVPWGIYIQLTHRLEGFKSFQYFHPIFWYEQILLLVLLAILLYTYKRYNADTISRQTFHGSILAGVYLIGYGIVRLIVEQYRIDVLWVGDWSFGEAMSVLQIMLGLIILGVNYYRRSHGKN